MNNFGNSEPLDYNAIFQSVIKKSIKNDSSEILALIMFFKNMGYSKKKIQTEIRKYKRYKKRKNSVYIN